MHGEKKSLITMMVMAPVLFWGWCGLSYTLLGFVPEGNLRTAAWVTAGCIAAGAFLVWFTRKAKQNRIYLHIKPNAIEVEGAEKFNGTFSSETQFLVSTEAFQETLNAVADRKSYAQGRLFFSRESACARIWPGSLRLSELELEAIKHALAEVFIELKIEVMDNKPGNGSQETAIKA